MEQSPTVGIEDITTVTTGTGKLHRITVGVYVTMLVLVFAWLGAWFIQNVLSTDAGSSNLDEVFSTTLKLMYASWLIASGAIGLSMYLWFTREDQARILAEKMTGGVLSYFQQFQQLYDNSPVPYFMLDPTGAIGNPNKSAVRFFVASAESDLQGRNLYEMFFEQESMKGVTSLLKTKLERGIPINKQEMQIKLLNGDTRWVLLTVFVMEHVGKRKRTGLAALVDITQEKEIDKVKTEFVSLASHQLRTPLTSVKWQIDMLRTSKKLIVTPEILLYLEKIYHGNERMIELVDTLLNVSRIEMGTLAVDTHEVDLVQLFDDTLEEVSLDFQDKHLVLEKTFEPTCVVNTDPHLVRIVIQNLLTNAARYTPEGGHIILKVSCNAGGALLSVADSGCGISPEDQKHIFTKMFRADNAKKMVAQGTGLGLYMSKAFIERLGGSIAFESETDKGTKFTVTIPPFSKVAATVKKSF